MVDLGENYHFTETSLYATSRILITIFSVSVWHQMLNELASSGSLQINTCRLQNVWFLLFTMLHFVYNLLCFYVVEHVILWYSCIINILYGSFIIMALKPPEWFFSFQWEDCYSLYNDNDALGRLIMFSYVLITIGATEILYISMHYELEDIWKQRFRLKKDIIFTWSLFGILFLLLAVLFCICLLMVWLAGGL